MANKSWSVTYELECTDIYTCSYIGTKQQVERTADAFADRYDASVLSIKLIEDW